MDFSRYQGNVVFWVMSVWMIIVYSIMWLALRNEKKFLAQNHEDDHH